MADQSLDRINSTKFYFKILNQIPFSYCKTLILKQNLDFETKP